MSELNRLLIFITITCFLPIASSKTIFSKEDQSRNPKLAMAISLFKTSTHRHNDFWDDSSYGSAKTFSFVSSSVDSDNFLPELISFARGMINIHDREIFYQPIENNSRAISKYLQEKIFEFADSPISGRLAKRLAKLIQKSGSTKQIITGADFNHLGRCNWLLIIDSTNREATLVNGCEDFNGDEL